MAALGLQIPPSFIISTEARHFSGTSGVS